MADTAALVVALSAQLTKFQKDMDDANGIAAQSVKRIESTFKTLNPDASGVLKNFADSGRGPAESAGAAIGTALLLGFAGVIAGIVTKMGGIIDGLAKIGDRAEDLRLPVNLLQALSVAADAARVSQSDLNKGLDAFASVSKKTEADASEFYTALRNINSGFVDAFKAASSQEERLKIVGNAYNSTSDEIKKAQLGLQAFNTDNVRTLSVLGENAAAMDRTKERMRALGLEIDESAVQRAQEARTNLALLARVFTDQLSSALAGFIPTLVEIVPLLEGMATAVRTVLEAFASAQNRPIEKLNAQIAALETEIQQAQDASQKIAEGKRAVGEGFQGQFNTWVGGMIAEMAGQTDDVALDANEERIARLKGQLDDLKKARDLGIAIRTGASPAQGPPPPFKPRPSLKEPATSAKDPFEQQVDSINRHIAALNADAAAVGKTEAAHQGLRTELSLLQAIERAGGEVTQKQIDTYSILRATMSQKQALDESGIRLNKEHADSFSTISDRMVQAAGRASELQRAYLGVQSAIQFGGNELINIMDALRTKTQTASEAMRSLTNNLIRALEQALLLGSGPLAGIFGTASKVSGGTGGILGALFSSFGTPGKQGGGPVSAGRPYVVGEHGPELFVPQSAGRVMPNAISQGRAAGGTSVEINNYVAADTETKQTRQEGPTGDRIIIDIVKKAQARGELDDVNRGRFGLRPAKVR